jgi:radical SAM protein with 4Fe4S-binding SPASM domain
MCDIPDIKLEELPAQAWKQVIADAALTGAHTIVFSGGEPLLRKDIFELISFTRENQMNACLTSNGIAIDRDCAAKLKQSGINVVNISIEGREATHDFLRGKGTYRKAINALKELTGKGIEATVAATVSRYNFKELSDIVDITAKAKATTLRFQPFNSLFLNDKSKKNDFFIGLAEKDILVQQIEKVVDLAAEYKIAINPPGYLRMIPGYLASGSTLPSKGCNALWTSCPINSQGEIFACWVLAKPEFKAGDIRQNRFIHIWDSPLHERIRQDITAKTCKGCLMSCYDQVYAGPPTAGQIINKAKKITNKNAWIRQKNKIFQGLRKTGAHFKRKYSFYLTYRGSVRKVVIRGLNMLKRNTMFTNQQDHDSDHLALIKEIDRAKQILIMQRRKTQ